MNNKKAIRNNLVAFITKLQVAFILFNKFDLYKIVAIYKLI